MTLDDETAERIADEKARERGDYNGVGQPIPLGEYVRAGWDARDAEVEELRAVLAKVREWAKEAQAYYEPAGDSVLAILDESPTERETPAAESSEEVIVRDSIFRRDELPEVLGRMIDARDEAAREAKNYYLRLQDAEATLMGEQGKEQGA